MTLKETYAVSTLKALTIKDNDYDVLRYIEHGEIKTRVVNNLVMEAKILLTEYREAERVENGDILDTAVIKLIVYNKGNDCTKDYIVHVSLADYSTDNYDVILKRGNDKIMQAVFDSTGGVIDGDVSMYVNEFAENTEEVTEFIADILFTYSPDEDKKTVVLGLINPFWLIYKNFLYKEYLYKKFLYKRNLYKEYLYKEYL